MDFNENERTCYELCLDLAKKSNNRKALQQLESIGHPPCADWEKGLYCRSEWADKFKTTILKGNLTVQYFEKLIAPDKQPLWFEHSAHMCFLEEPEKFYGETAKFFLK